MQNNEDDFKQYVSQSELKKIVTSSFEPVKYTSFEKQLIHFSFILFSCVLLSVVFLSKDFIQDNRIVLGLIFAASCLMFMVPDITAAFRTGKIKIKTIAVDRYTQPILFWFMLVIRFSIAVGCVWLLYYFMLY